MPATFGKFGGTDITTPTGRQKVESTEDQENAARLSAQIAQQLFSETGPLRAAGLQGLQGFLQTGTLPTGLNVGLDKILTTGREGLEGQYNVARQNILGRTPGQGGQLNAQLAALEIARAGQIGRLGADIQAQYEMPLRSQLFSSSLGLGFGAPSQSIAGLLGAGGQFGNIASRAQREQLQREKDSKQEIVMLMAALA